MKVGVIGLGLIGGSIFKNLSGNNKYEVIGVSGSVNHENVYRDYSVLKECELVFVCTPMNKTLEILENLESVLTSDTIVTDVCSLKEFVSRRKYGFKFIPSHPMAGTEHSGWEYSFPELFIGANWAVTPKEDTNIKDFELLKSVISDLGASIVLTTPKEHDEAVALISHLPMVIAQALCKNIENNNLAQKLASSGFRDTTRLALSNTEMASDMVLLNESNIKAGLKLLIENAESLFSPEYAHEAQRIKDFRNKLYT